MAMFPFMTKVACVMEQVRLYQVTEQVPKESVIPVVSKIVA